jgi:hypothetical protein
MDFIVGTQGGALKTTDFLPRVIQDSVRLGCLPDEDCDCSVAARALECVEPGLLQSMPGPDEIVRRMVRSMVESGQLPRAASPRKTPR